MARDLGSSSWDARQSPLTGTNAELRESNTGHLERDLLEKRAEPPVLALCEPPCPQNKSTCISNFLQVVHIVGFNFLRWKGGRCRGRKKEEGDGVGERERDMWWGWVVGR